MLLFNDGARKIITKSGVLNPKSSLEVTEEEAKFLLKYPDIKDTAVMLGVKKEVPVEQPKLVEKDVEQVEKTVKRKKGK